MVKNEIVHYPHGEGGSVFLHERTSLEVVTNIIQPVTCGLVSYMYFLGIIETLAIRHKCGLQTW